MYTRPSKAFIYFSIILFLSSYLAPVTPHILNTSYPSPEHSIYDNHTEANLSSSRSTACEWPCTDPERIYHGLEQALSEDATFSTILCFHIKVPLLLSVSFLRLSMTLGFMPALAIPQVLSMLLFSCLSLLALYDWIFNVGCIQYLRNSY